MKRQSPHAYPRLTLSMMRLGSAVQTKGLGSGYARRMNNISFDAARPQPTCQPEAAAAGLEGDSDAHDRAPLQSTIISMFNATSSPEPRCEISEPKQQPSGRLRARHEPGKSQLTSPYIDRHRDNAPLEVPVESSGRAVDDHGSRECAPANYLNYGCHALKPCAEVGVVGWLPTAVRLRQGRTRHIGENRRGWRAGVTHILWGSLQAFEIPGRFAA